MSTESTESLQSKLRDIFECVKLFEVEGGSVPAGGDSPTHGFGINNLANYTNVQC